MFDRRLVINFDFFLLSLVFLLCFLGLVNLKSICEPSEGFAVFFNKQIYWGILGFIFLFIIININYVSIVRYSTYIHIITLLLLFLVLILGEERYGAQRWLSMGFFTFQPSEIAKITLILCLSKFFGENVSSRPFKISDLSKPFFITFITFIPIYLQPDLGTSGIIILLFLSFLYFININKKSLFFIFSLILSVIPLLWFVLKDYQRQRILTFFRPEMDPLNTGYQIIQSKIAVGSGGFLGKGFMEGTQSQLRFLPVQHTDFVFSVWAEEWGFVGCLLIVFLFFILIYKGLSIAYKSKNLYGSFLGIGLSFFFLWHIIINFLMTVGLFPVVGVPLPFFSYGGSYMLTCLISIGLLLNISMRKFK